MFRPQTGSVLVCLHSVHRLVVSCDGSSLHRVSPYQFINSPEWEADEAAMRVAKDTENEQAFRPPDPNPIYQVGTYIVR